MKLRAFSIEEKLQAVKTAKAQSKRAAARTHNVCVKRIREWCKQENELRAVKKKNLKRLPGGGRPLKCERMEEQLITWIESQRKLSLRVSRQMIQRKAIEVLFGGAPDDEKENTEFTASDGWLTKFLKRNHFSLRKRTTIAQKTPEDIAEKVISYIIFVEGLRRNCAYRSSAIGAADETAVWIDPLQDFTIEKVGTKTVSLFSTGNQKAKFTVTLAAMADGNKLPPLIVLKGKIMPAELKNFRGAIITMSKNGWMNEDTTLEWLTKVWGSFSFGRRLLAWDAYRCHKTPAVKAELKKMRTDAAVIPGGCTSLLQAPDVCWNKTFKAHYVQLYEEWVNSVGCTFENRTISGNPRPPSKLVLCQWVVEAWKLVPKELIVKSFLICGLTSRLDGSNDDEIRSVSELGLQRRLKTARESTQLRDIENEVSSSDESVIPVSNESDSDSQ